MADLFGVKLVTATIARFSQDCAQRFQGFADAVRDRVAAAPVKHMDETGFPDWRQDAVAAHRLDGLAHLLHRVSAKQGSLLAKVTGIVVHDHWKPYYTMTGVLHALCNAHHLRELKALVEIEKEDWAHKMQRLLRRACPRDEPCARAGCAADAGPDRTDRAQLRRESSRQVWSSTRHSPRWQRPGAAVAHHDGSATICCCAADTRKSDVLRFLSESRLCPSPTTWRSKDGRMMKLRQENLRRLPLRGWCEGFCRHPFQCSRSARKRGWNMLRTLTGDPVRPDRNRHPAGPAVAPLRYLGCYKKNGMRGVRGCAKKSDAGQVCGVCEKIITRACVRKKSRVSENTGGWETPFHPPQPPSAPPDRRGSSDQRGRPLLVRSTTSL